MVILSHREARNLLPAPVTAMTAKADSSHSFGMTRWAFRMTGLGVRNCGLPGYFFAPGANLMTSEPDRT